MTKHELPELWQRMIADSCWKLFRTAQAQGFKDRDNHIRDC